MSIIQDPESGAWYDDEADLAPDPMDDPRVKALVEAAKDAIVSMQEALTTLQAERDALKAALARAYEAGRDDAAAKAEARHALCERDNVGQCFLRKCAIGNVIRDLTPPADLTERVSGTPDRGKMIKPCAECLAAMKGGDNGKSD